MAKKTLYREISPDLTIPGFDVKVGKSRSTCRVKSKDGRHQFLARVNLVESERNSYYALRIQGPMFPKPLTTELYHCGLDLYDGGAQEVAQCADDVITNVANSLRLMDVFSSDGFSADGFSARIDGEKMVLSHSSKPDYSLEMSIAKAIRLNGLSRSPYAVVYYSGPEYNPCTPKIICGEYITNLRYVPIPKNVEKFADELKARVLKLGEPDTRIFQWVGNEIGEALLSYGFTITPRPEKNVVEISHPVGISGSYSISPYTVGEDFDFKLQCPNPHFPADIETSNVVFFTYSLPDTQTQEPPVTSEYQITWGSEAIEEIQTILALSLVYQEFRNTFKSNILTPRLKNKGEILQLVNTELEGDESVILTLACEYCYKKDKYHLVLNGMEKKLTFPFTDTPTVVDTKKVTQDMVELAEEYVRKFRQEKISLLTRVEEIDI
jgi:hypothetical protein